MGSIGLSVATDSVRVVKQVVKLRVLPTAAHAAALEETLRTCNAAASWLSAQMHAGRAFRKIDAQHRFYRELRARFGLAAQPAIRVIGKVAECYAGLHANLAAGNYGPPGSDRRRRIEGSPIAFRSSAAQPFDARCLSWQFPDEMGRTATMSIWTVTGGMKSVPIVGNPKHLMLLRTRTIGETDLIHRDGKWFLHATIEAPEAPSIQPTNGFLGVDTGIVNIATTSTGQNASGARLNSHRKRQARLRKRLQAKKTSSARRLLRTFAQLGSFLAYKARQAGVAFIQVDPAYTSRTCSACGWVDKKNRRTQAVFECGRCGFVGHADHNAAINIAVRGAERWGEVMRPNAAPTLAAS
jgi:putative transposase